MSNDMIDQVRRLAPPAEVNELERRRQRQKLDAVLVAKARQSSSRGVAPRRKGLPSARLLIAGVAAAVVLVVSGLVMTSSGSKHPSVAPEARGVQPMPKAQLVDFTTSAGEVIAQITDPLAAASELDTVFQQHGFDISVKLIPVSPSLVGSITAMGLEAGTSDIKAMQSGPCISGGRTCTVGLILPADFHGQASVEVGRAAQPGEAYVSAASAFAPGEVLHCENVLNEQVSAATPTLAATGETVDWREDVPTGSAGPGAENGEVEDLATPPPGDYVVNITTLSSAALIAWVAPQPSDAFAQTAQQANQGCSGGNSGATSNTGTSNGNTGTTGNSGAAGSPTTTTLPPASNTGTAAS